MKEHDSNELIDIIKTLRTCPPPDRKTGKNWEKHVKKCEFCRMEENKIWEDFAYELKPYFNDPIPASRPSKGDIRQIDHGKGRWVNENYMNPPLVLVLDINEKKRTASCIMLCHETDAAGPGDLVLPEKITGFMDLTAETWNTITVKTSSLGSEIGSVSHDRLDDIKRFRENTSVPPAWAFVPLSIHNENDPRIKTRKIEKMTAAFFSLSPLDALEVETDALSKQFCNMLQGFDELLKKKRNLTEAALSFTFKSFQKPAFAHDSENQIPVDFRTMIIKYDSLVNYYPSAGVVETDETVKNRRTITGKGTTLPDSGLFAFIACLVLSSGEFLQAEKAEINQDGFFLAEFDVDNISDHHLARPVFCSVYQVGSDEDNI